ncbi:GNAT family N-acetyltransferase [Sutcliffiella sp. NC1]|uniref:GNAT family N-acetyltransferase n=1 Tax=Sutcliffiella sp. NC1 TaxID=3004096 RepID=UPI0022DD0C97|nr:GNAT family N-acetyltransferase [Sutcliffiella sp. NC1]WBL15960.1 GNAT family N-acetyltransferase [Sutcliffiella sp. NC1]
MFVRKLVSVDAATYWNLRLEALKQNPEAFASSYEEALQKENPIEQVQQNLTAKGSYTFGAFIENKLVGMVTLVQEKAIKLSHRANIFAMYVSPTARGTGVAKALIQTAIDEAKTLDGVIKINLTVVASNESAKRLYNSVGFQVYGTEKKALKVNETYYDEEHMVLFLD